MGVEHVAALQVQFSLYDHFDTENAGFKNHDQVNPKDPRLSLKLARFVPRSILWTTFPILAFTASTPCTVIGCTCERPTSPRSRPKLNQVLPNSKLY